jgi:hypothetical protein
MARRLQPAFVLCNAPEVVTEGPAEDEFDSPTTATAATITTRQGGRLFVEITCDERD